MSRKISDLSEGTLVYIDEIINNVTEHVPYIYLGLDDYGKARVYRQYTAYSSKMNNAYTTVYNGSVVDAYYENETTGFLARFDSATRNAMAYTTITYADYDLDPDHNGQLVTLSRRCFVLSRTELGYNASSLGSEGKSFLGALKTFYGTANDNTARVCRNSASGNGIMSWTRSGRNAGNFWLIETSGGETYRSASSSNISSRPAISFDPNTPVSDEGAEAIFLLPDGRITTWGIQAEMSLGTTINMPKKCKIVIPTDVAQSEDIKVCNNYGDAEPTWVPCENGGVATFGTSKTADNWELGVKVHMEYSLQGKKMGEPAMIVEFE